MRNHLLKHLLPAKASHRGNSQHGENTLRGILEAINSGFKIVEVDVASTRDNVLILYHDPIIEGTIIKTQYFKKISTFNSSITLLDTLFENIRNLDVVVNLDCADTKRLTVKNLINVIKKVKRYSLEEKVYIEVPKWRLPLCLIMGRNLVYEIVFDHLNWKYYFFEPILHVAPNVVILNRIPNTDNIRKIHQKGYKISYWTAQNSTEAEKYLKMGYDIVGVNE